MRPSSVLLLSLLLLATLLLSSSSAKPLPLADHAPQPLVSRNSIFLVVYIWHFQFQFYNQNIPMYALQSIFIIINDMELEILDMISYPLIGNYRYVTR